MLETYHRVLHGMVKISVYSGNPTSSQHMTSVECVTIVEDMSPEEKDTFKQRHGIDLDPRKHALVMYFVDAEDWSPDLDY